MYIGFIDHFNAQLVTANNYSATADLHDSQINTAPTKLFSSLLRLQQSFPSNGF
jgi:hypothetical protein